MLAITRLGDLRSIRAADDAHSNSVAFGAGLGHEFRVWQARGCVYRGVSCVKPAAICPNAN
jgi:hypothetical protein